MSIVGFIQNEQEMNKPAEGYERYENRAGLLAD